MFVTKRGSHSFSAGRSPRAGREKPAIVDVLARRGSFSGVSSLSRTVDCIIVSIRQKVRGQISDGDALIQRLIVDP